MRDVGIDGRQMVFPVHQADHFRADYEDAMFPVAGDISSHTLHLPSGTGLQADQIDRICDVVIEWIERNDP